MRRSRAMVVLFVLAQIFAGTVFARAGSEQEEPGRTYTATFSVAREGGNPPVREYVLTLSDGGRPANLHAGARIAIPATNFPARADGGATVPVASFTYQNIGFRASLEAGAREDGMVRLRGKVADDRIDRATTDKAESASPVLRTFEFVFDVVMSVGETRDLARFDDRLSGRVVLSLRIE